MPDDRAINGGRVAPETREQGMAHMILNYFRRHQWDEVETILIVGGALTAIATILFRVVLERVAV